MKKQIYFGQFTDYAEYPVEASVRWHELFPPNKSKPEAK